MQHIKSCTWYYGSSTSKVWNQPTCSIAGAWPHIIYMLVSLLFLYNLREFSMIIKFSMTLTGICNEWPYPQLLTRITALWSSIVPSVRFHMLVPVQLVSHIQEARSSWFPESPNNFPGKRLNHSRSNECYRATSRLMREWPLATMITAPRAARSPPIF